MPELPEVETVRRDLADHVVGQRVERVEVSGRRTVRRQDSDELVARLAGATFSSAGRKGKYLVLSTQEGDQLVVHLRMSGQLRLVPAGVPLAPHTHGRFWLHGGGELRFVDPRTFGELFVADENEMGALAPTLAELGVDPLDGFMPRRVFAAALARHRVGIKAMLLRQDLVAGIGNIYSDEICAAAGVRPTRGCDSLTSREVTRVWEAVPAVLSEAVEARGSSLSDAQYVDLFGRPGRYQVQHRVYARAGTGCGRCGTIIERAKFQQRSTSWCPRCQH